MENALLQLVLPDVRHEEAVMAFREAFRRDETVPGAGNLERFDDYSAWLASLRRNEHASTVEEGYVPCLTFLAFDGDDLVGAANLRLHLNERLRLRGGHIGYAVRPDRRRQGYARRILRQAVSLANGFGIDPVLVTCLETNEASRRVIVACGGRYQGTDIVDGSPEERYLIASKELAS